MHGAGVLHEFAFVGCDVELRRIERSLRGKERGPTRIGEQAVHGVAQTREEGQVAGAMGRPREHFVHQGVARGRLPNAAFKFFQTRTTESAIPVGAVVAVIDEVA